MKKSGIKAAMSELRAELSEEFIGENSEKQRFEAFFRGAAMRYIRANKLPTDICSIGKVFPYIFPETGSDIFSAAERAHKTLLRIPDELWRGNVQLIGQLYQYFNSDAKNRALSGLKRSVKVGADNISAATQIFTPDWIVRYMTENTLGRIFVGSCGFDEKNMSFYIPCHVSRRYASPEDISLIDPCAGSGNILVCAFDMFMELYRSHGYPCRQAAELILTKNIFGLDIDSRVCRIAHFALIMRAASYAPEILGSPLELNILDMEGLGGEDSFSRQFLHSELCGSLIRPTTPPADKNTKAARVYGLLTRRYSAAVTNPPYLSCGNMEHQLLSFIKKNYYRFRADLFSAFICRCSELTDPDGYMGFLTPYVWMFIHSYEELRHMMFREKTLESLVQFEYSAFDDATVPLCAFTMQNRSTGEKGQYFRLTEFRGGLDVQRKKLLDAVSGKERSYVFSAGTEDFDMIPSSPAAYWISPKVRALFGKYPPLGSIAAPRKGNSTSDNDRFLRMWFEVEFSKLNLNCTRINRAETRRKRWFPYNKGGGYRKWYGFNDYVIDWYDDGAEIRAIPTAVIANYQYFMKAGLTWSTLTSGKFSIRQFGEGYIFDNGGCCIFELGEKKDFICALLNSKVFAYIFGQLNPTLNFQSGEVAKFPVIYKNSPEVSRLAEECTEISRSEYDSFETSINFKRHPLI